MAISILNDVLGPVMRGPSSSHTAGSYFIGRLLRALVGSPVVRARFTFDPDGSYARVYREQGVDRGFAAALMDWPLTDSRFVDALTLASKAGMDLGFDVAPLAESSHPNDVDAELDGCAGAHLRARARSIGGGAVEIVAIDGWPVRLDGQTDTLMVEVTAAGESGVRDALGRDIGEIERLVRGPAPGDVLLVARPATGVPAGLVRSLAGATGVRSVRAAPPLAFVKRGAPLFTDAAAMVALSESRDCSLGALAIESEAQLLGLSAGDVRDELLRRFDIMRQAVADGLGPAAPQMQLLEPTAPAVFRAEAEGRVAVGGLHTRAAARALAVMHVAGGMGVVCAAPTGGSAGVLPGVVVTLADERNVDRDTLARALAAASAIGVVLATRATFAAEVAGCQVEIGAAGAMAAAAVVEASGGSARQAADAAAIAFQNTMGSVCDLVQGIVEIPCHTRNAVAASSAFICADLVMGGYQNPIPLDETIDAVYAVGRMLPVELRCTAQGGLAVTPSAVALRRRPL